MEDVAAAELATRVESATVESLRRELDTDWLPDPWRLKDFVGHVTDLPKIDSLRSPELMAVPFVGGRTRVVPALDPWTRVVFQQLAARVSMDAEPRLSPAVFAYRVDDHGVIEHYRSALARRQAVERALAQNHALVVQLDVRRFFPSVTIELLDEVTQTPSLFSPLRRLLVRFVDWFGYAIPEGYAASRTLANLALMPVDSRIDRPFTRWVDDYRVFCDTMSDAERIVGLFGSALELVGLKPEDNKTLIRPSSSVASGDTSSLGLHEHGPSYEPSGARQDVATERRMRLNLRLAAERGTTGIVESLLREGLGAIPPSALPRLAWLLARVPWTDESTKLLAGLIEVRDELHAWRVGRLGAALWFAPTQVVSQLTSQLIDATRHAPPARPILARVLARHLPQVLPELERAWDDDSWRRAWRLSSLEAGSSVALDSRFKPPPVSSFL